MVRRCLGRLEDVADLSHLAAAFHRAALGKWTRPEVRSFADDLDRNLVLLREAVLAGSAPRGVYRKFQIRDPKPRVIHAPIFEDRIVHHALMDVLGPTLDRALIDDTYACRVGRGCLAAVHRAQHHVRRFSWYAKVDIRKYFASIPHGRLKRLVGKKIKDADLRQMVFRIIDRFAPGLEYGLPIGAVTSQWLANYFLSPLDRYLIEDGRTRAAYRNANHRSNRNSNLGFRI